jgi:hypoxanthine phosphoribosyltransferase
MVTATVVSFVVGVLSSLAASWVLLLRERARLRLRFRAILAHIVTLAKQLEQDDYIPDYIVTVDRNSGVVGSILAGHIGLKSVVSVSTVNHRLPDGSREIRLDPLSAGALRLLKGVRVLVLICCNDTGTSLGYVVRFLRELGNDGPCEIRTAAIYTSVSPAIRPTYRVVLVGHQTRQSMNRIISRLPWMTSGWQHVLGTERLAPR